MSVSAPKTRLFVAEDLASGREIALGKASAHRLVTVLRARPGERVLVFNGRDGEWRARLPRADKRGAVLEVEAQERGQEAEIERVLAFAPVKRAQTDLIVEKATELGVSRFLPVMTRRTVAERVKLDRLAAIAREAAEQCGRLSVPAIAEPMALTAFLETWPTSRAFLVCDAHGRGPAILKALATMDPLPAGALVGPEGGFPESEQTQLDSHPAMRPVSLGPTVLRAETAAVAALTILQTVGESR